MRKVLARSLLYVVYISCLTSTLLENQLHAAVGVEAGTAGNVGSGTGTNSAASGEVISEFSGTNLSATNQASARASFGLLEAYTEGIISNQGTNNDFSMLITATATFVDDITINSPGRIGQTGTMTFRLEIIGSPSVSISSGPEVSYAQAALTVRRDSYDFFFRDDRERINSDRTTDNLGSPFLNRTEDISIPISFGSPLELTIALRAEINCRSEFGASSVANINLRWEGIVSVKNFASTEVEYSVTSASGTDYAVPIFPHLTIAPLNAGQLKLSWATNYPACTLESSTALSSGWQAVTNSTSIAGDQHTLTIDPSETSRFFRLRKN